MKQQGVLLPTPGWDVSPVHLLKIDCTTPKEDFKKENAIHSD